MHRSMHILKGNALQLPFKASRDIQLSFTDQIPEVCDVLTGVMVSGDHADRHVSPRQR